MSYTHDTFDALRELDGQIEQHQVTDYAKWRLVALMVRAVVLAILAVAVAVEGER